MIELKICPSKWEELLKRGYTLDIIYRLKMIQGEYDNSYTLPKIVSLEQTLIRKGLATDEGKITKEGTELLDFVGKGEKVKLERKKKDNSPFLLWWKEYPATDSFTYKGREFKGSRALKAKKNDCETKLNKILSEGEFTIEELVNALKLEISQKAEASIKSGTNKMSFFQNSMTYLNQGTYEPYVELVRKGHKPIEDSKKEEKSVYGGISI